MKKIRRVLLYMLYLFQIPFMIAKQSIQSDLCFYSRSITVPACHGLSGSSSVRSFKTM